MEKDMLASRRNYNVYENNKSIIRNSHHHGGPRDEWPLSSLSSLSAHQWLYDYVRSRFSRPYREFGRVYSQFQHLSETIYLDAGAGTIRQVGTISYTASAANIQFQETQEIPAQFPNPPTSAVGNITVNLAPSAGILSFDTGAVPFSWNSSVNAYIAAPFIPTLGSFTGSYSLVTGGQTTNGSFSYTLNAVDAFAYNFSAVVFQTLYTTNYPASLTFGQNGYADTVSALGMNSRMFTGGSLYGGPTVVADVTATNGFHMQLSPGLTSGFWGRAESFVWSCSIPVTATNVPSGAASITNQPQSVVVHAHDTASFSVAASGTVPLSYQWSLNGTNISGATSSSLTIPNVVQRNLGTYSVVVTNAFGSATSSNATLSMYPFIGFFGDHNG
jgi:hypothetical protein